MKTISIIGAGAAGLMTAAAILESTNLLEKGGAEERGGGLAVSDIEGNQSSVTSKTGQLLSQGAFRIHLFDKNPISGTKVALAGGGRCNLTTGIEDKKILLSKYTRGSEFIKKALGKFSPKKCGEWFESHGLPLKVESDNRVFPVSDDGRDVVDVFEDIFAKHRNNITMHYGEGVVGTSLLSSCKDPFQNHVGEIDKQNLLSEGKSDSSALLRNDKKSFLITTPKGTYESDVLVITTGGNAYSHTGSTGDGYTFAKNLGHTITKLGPSLSSFLTKEKWMHELSGLAFQNSQLKINNLQLSGPLLLTHFGISGPLAFQLSSHLAWEEMNKDHPKIVLFSPIAEMGLSDWNEFFKVQFQNHPKKLIVSIIAEKLPRRFVEGFIHEYFPQLKEIFAASVSREERENIAKLLGEGIPLTLLERRPGDEFVTAGGVDTGEVNPETMESKIQKNLYFAGEVLNVDAVTGGFNLQACWAGGYSVGKNIAQQLSE